MTHEQHRSGCTCTDGDAREGTASQDRPLHQYKLGRLVWLGGSLPICGGARPEIQDLVQVPSCPDHLPDLSPILAAFPPLHQDLCREMGGRAPRLQLHQPLSDHLQNTLQLFVFEMSCGQSSAGGEHKMACHAMPNGPKEKEGGPAHTQLTTLTVVQTHDIPAWPRVHL